MPPFSFAKLTKQIFHPLALKYRVVYTLAMNETYLGHVNGYTVLKKQHYLFDLGGDVVIGYYLWRGSVIVATYDSTCGMEMDSLDSHSRVRLLSLEEAREDWTKRTRGDSLIVFVPTLTGKSEREAVLKSICEVVAMRYYNMQEASIQKAIEAGRAGVVTKNWMNIDDPSQTDTQYALKA